MEEAIELNRILNLLPDFGGLPHHIAEGRGSSPLLPTTSSSDPDSVPLYDLLMTLLGQDGRRWSGGLPTNVSQTPRFVSY
jgi:hypothetical protein